MGQDDKLFNMPLEPTDIKKEIKIEIPKIHINKEYNEKIIDTIKDNELKSTTIMVQKVFKEIELIEIDGEKIEPIKNKKIMEEKSIYKEKEYKYDDPRSDLPDHLIWKDILILMHFKDKELCEILRLTRGLGTTLKDNKGNFKLIYPDKWNEQDENNYKEKYLKPHITEINIIFKKIYDKFKYIKLGLKQYEEELPF